MPTAQIHGVIHQRQLTARACWYTCLQMVVRYYESVNQTCSSTLVSPEHFPHMQTRFSAGSNPSWAEWWQWAEQCGFTPLNLSPNKDGIYHFIDTYGPIVYSGTWGNTFDGHVVVITGINTDTETLYIDDPLDQSAPTSKDFNTYMSQLTQTLWENPLFVVSHS